MRSPGLVLAAILMLAACERAPAATDGASAPEGVATGVEEPQPPVPADTPGPDGGALPYVEASATQCVQGETHLYSCPMADGRVVSVCVGNRQVSYRYGPIGEPEIDITVPQGQAGVWQGDMRGQGGGHQTQIRFVRGGFDYIVWSGTAGSLTDIPGQAYSGVTVMRGDETVNRLECPATSSQTAIPFSMIPDYIPFEDAGGDYDAWF